MGRPNLAHISHVVITYEIRTGARAERRQRPFVIGLPPGLSRLPGIDGR
jgi:hypothetical protein